MTKWGNDALEEATRLDVPPRSVLFSLKLEGASGATREGVLEYAQRLAHEHQVPVRKLLAEIILPEAQIKGAFFIPGHFSGHAIKGCNGWSRYAIAFTGAMQRLTGRADVANGSMSAWAKLFSDQGYAVARRRWCRECLRAQGGNVVTYSLLWSFDVARVCPIHQLDLADVCHFCGAPQPTVSDALIEGLCFRCGRSLLDGGNTQTLWKDPREAFFAQSVANMISVGGQARGFASVDNYKRRLMEAAVDTCGGSLWKLERILGLSDGLLRASGRRRFPLFLEIAYRLGVDPVTFLGPNTAPIEPVVPCNTRYRLLRQYSIEEVADIRQRAQSSLTEALARADRLTTRREFAKSAGVEISSLASLLPDAVASLGAHNKRIRMSVRRQRRRRQSKLVRGAMLDLSTTSGPFTSISIRRAMQSVGVHPRDKPLRRMAIRMLKVLLAKKNDFVLVG